MVIKTFAKSWWIIAKNNFQNQLLTPSSSILFIVGKIFNFGFSLLTILAIFHQTNYINGYSLNQAIIFVLVFNFIDSVTQFTFRSLYSFRPILIKGDFDLDLLKPLPSSFRPLFSGPDFLEFPLTVLKFFVMIYFFVHYHINFSTNQIFISIFMFINAILLGFAIHLAVAGFSILTTEIDNLITIYRALGQAAVIPTDIYHGFFRFLLDYIIPISIMFTIPSKAFLGILTPQGIIYSCWLTYSFLAFSLWFWQYALRHYTSASS